MATEKKLTKKQMDNIRKIELEYSLKLDDAMGKLHNTFVEAIREAKLPSVQVLAVLQMLLSEATTMVIKQYIKEQKNGVNLEETSL